MGGADARVIYSEIFMTLSNGVNIGFFDLEGWEEKMIGDAFLGHTIQFYKEKLHEYTGSEFGFEIISVFVNSEVTKEVLEKFPNLKLIVTRSTGYDHIDLGYCKEKNITVAFVPGYGDNTVAEFAFALILSLTRKMYESINHLKETGAFSYKGFRGIDLKKKTIGVIGTGRIGKESINIAKGFGMNVIAYDPYPNEEYAKQIGFKYMPLDELLSSSDVITIHTPLNDGTFHLLNMENIGLIKRGAYLVNTARGGIVETQALVYALEKGILAGAGLDVLEEEGEVKDEMKFLKEDGGDTISTVKDLLKGETSTEKLKTVIANHILMKMPNVLITPHNAFNTQEALERILNTTLENIKGFVNNTLLPKNIAK